MSQPAVRIVNVLLFSMCCFFSAGVFNHVFDRLLAPDHVSVFPPRPLSSAQASSWEARKPILERNLFGVRWETSGLSTVVEPEPAPEDVVDTRLPLQLLGTMVGDPESLSEAVILNTKMKEHMVLRLGDALEFNPDTVVHIIQPRRVLLKSERGIEELLLVKGASEAEVSARSEVGSRAAAAPGRRRALPSTARLAQRKSASVSSDLADAMNRMAATFANDMEPAFGSDGQIEGIRVTNLTEGGLLDEAGVTRDDLIRGVNGVEIKTPEAAKRVLRDLASCQPMTGMVVGRDGERAVEFSAALLKKFDCSE